MSLAHWERTALRVFILLVASYGILGKIDGDIPIPETVFTGVGCAAAVILIVLLPALAVLRAVRGTSPARRAKAIALLMRWLTEAWSGVEDPPTRAGLFVARLLLVAAAVTILIYIGPLTANDIRFQPGVAEHDLENPRFVLAVFILLPTILALIAATFIVRVTLISAVIILCLGSIEGAAVLYRQMVIPAASPLTVKSDGDSIWNPTCGKMGTCLNPNTRVHVVGTVGDRTIYDAIYEIDDAGSRRSLPEEDTRHRPNFISFFGDSNTFGMTVNGPDTLPGQVAKLACDYLPYNFGVEGGGTSNMLGAFDIGLVERGVKQRQGYFVYVYRHNHIDRNIGDSVSILWGKNFPAYDFDASGELVYQGTLWTHRPFRNAVSTLFDRLDALSALHIRYPFFLGKSDIALTGAILSKTRNLSQRQFPQSNFVVVLADHIADRANDAFVQSLKGLPVRVLDYASLVPDTGEGMVTPYDRHPTALYHRKFAEHLVADLGIGSACAE